MVRAVAPRDLNKHGVRFMADDMLNLPAPRPPGADFFLRCSNQSCRLRCICVGAGLQWRIAFEFVPTTKDLGLYMDIFVDMSLGFDIILNLQRFYFHKRTGLLITEAGTIRKRYLQSWFLIDAVRSRTAHSCTSKVDLLCCLLNCSTDMKVVCRFRLSPSTGLQLPCCQIIPALTMELEVRACCG